jgi:hypothetical protein
MIAATCRVPRSWVVFACGPRHVLLRPLPHTRQETANYHPIYRSTFPTIATYLLLSVCAVCDLLLQHRAYHSSDFIWPFLCGENLTFLCSYLAIWVELSLGLNVRVNLSPGTKKGGGSGPSTAMCTLGAACLPVSIIITISIIKCSVILPGKIMTNQ